jgi:pimeloyl-ACP methyl ester carboxylesterase
VTTSPPSYTTSWDTICTSLHSFADGNIVVTETLEVPEGEALPSPATPNGQYTSPTPNLPHHCKITARLESRSGAAGEPYYIGIELRIPEHWNGRLFYQGGGGMNGTITSAFGNSTTTKSTSPLALAQGFAVVSTDGGHQGMSFDDTRFADDQQSKLNYGYAAIGKVAQSAKKLLQQATGRQPAYSYFVGCSNGGREAMVASQRFPTEFDGILAGNPAFHLNAAAVLANFSFFEYSNAASKLGLQPASLFSPADARLIQSSLLKQCDGLDGATDGMIFDQRACHFDVRSISCTTTQGDRCLDPVKVDAIMRAYRGPVDSAGKAIAGSWRMDASNFSPEWLVWQTGIQTPNGPMMVLPMLVRKSLTDYFAYPQYREPLLGGDDEAARLLAASADTAAYTNATSTQYSSFASRGGKMIIVTGWSDPIFSASELVAYYERLTNDTKTQHSDVALFSRLFLIPGMTHCGGGNALDDFDALTPLVNWVEGGQAPSTLIAKGKTFPGVERPICAFPTIARYNGNGTLNAASSFACRD